MPLVRGGKAPGPRTVRERSPERGHVKCPR
jgi:hypothetical protein